MVNIAETTKGLVLGICFLAYSFSTIAQERISFTWKGGSYYGIGFSASNDKQYTVDWEDGSGIQTRTGNYKITMTNAAIISHVNYPAEVIVEITVREVGTDATLSNLTVSGGELTSVSEEEHQKAIRDRVNILLL